MSATSNPSHPTIAACVSRQTDLRRRLFAVLAAALTWIASGGSAWAASPCDQATVPGQCGWYDAASAPPYVRDAIAAKGGILGAGNLLVLTSGDPADADSEISNDMGASGCGTNPDGWQTYDCVQLSQYVPIEDSVVLALSSEWFEWYQTFFTDWMTISGAGVATVDVSINSWIDNKVDILPYGPWETGTVILTSLSAAKMVDFRVADSGDQIYDTAIVVVPATWMANVGSTDGDKTLLCGNGTLEPGEDCDDGNYLADDDCSSLCLGSQPPNGTPQPASTCGNLSYTWPNGTTAPYTCGQDLCQGFRCVVGATISPACYTASQCADTCGGDCVDVQTAQLDCSTMCTVQPPATEPNPVLPATCDTLHYAWPDGTSMPYTCDDSCQGQRCVSGSTISPECFGIGECDATSCPDGTCVDTPAENCGDLCSLGEIGATCLPEQKDQTRVAANQQGACFGNFEACSGGGVWEIADGSWEPLAENCNGIDDDCNGVVDDLFVTCGDPGLCQNTINACDPNDPANPIVCQPLAPPSPFEICNDGLDNDCDGSADDGCQCGDDECMAGESYSNCAADCPPPADGTPCDDGDLCTADDQYQSGVCIPGAAVECDPGNACVSNPTCDPATGCSATKVDCTDAVECTVDSCDAVTGCAHTPDDAACDDADPCTTDSCDAITGCAHTPDPTCGGQDADVDGYFNLSSGGDDCNDDDATVHPGATEACNGADDDCDSIVDNGFDAGTPCESSANDCGATASGVLTCTVDGLGTVCDQAPPANPPGYGDACTSAANVCGATEAGTVQCDGSCSALTPVAADADTDGTADCIDACPSDAAKTAPGLCGCGTADVDSNGNGTVDCNETVFADVAAAAEARTRRPRVGRKVSFRVGLENLGPDPITAGEVEIVVTGASLSGLRLPRGCSGSVDLIRCDLGIVRSGRQRVRTISVVPNVATTVSVSVSASSEVLDQNPGNQTTVASTLVP